MSIIAFARRAGFAASAASLVVIAFVGAASAAGAPNRPAGSSDTDLVTGETFDKIIAALKENGLTAELGKDDTGDPHISGELDGLPYGLYFYGCNDNHEKCGVVQFAAGWDLPDGIKADMIEKWNHDNIWGTAYRDEEHDPWLTMPINLYGGVTPTNFSDSVDWWKVIVKSYEDHIGWNK